MKLYYFFFKTNYSSCSKKTWNEMKVAGSILIPPLALLLAGLSLLKKVEHQQSNWPFSSGPGIIMARRTTLSLERTK